MGSLKQTAERFDVKNIDCAMCAAKIEKGLNSVEGVDEAILDFASMTLHVRAENIVQIPTEVRKIEPDVELVPKSEDTSLKNEKSASSGIKKELVILSTATTLFILQLFSENWLHDNGLAKIELLIVYTAYFLAGWNVWLGAFRTIRKGTFFDENVLMVIATVGAMTIHAYSEAVGVMIFYKVGEMLQGLAVSRSRRSIKALLATKPDKAVLQTDSGNVIVAPESVGIGALILVKPGEKIPLDGDIVTGNSQLDTSALTGESLPVAAGPGDPVMAGQINKTGALTIRVTKPFNESSISKIMDLVETATARKAQTEKFITTFARYYTPAVVLIAVCVAIIPPIFVSDAAFKTWIYRALVILVISCPCALVVSIPLGYFGGIGKASQNGILVKGSNFIDALANVGTVVFDKTGTLTKGIFEVKKVVSLNGYTEDQLLEFAAAAEHQSTHPIASSIIEAFSSNGRKLNASKISDHVNIAGKGVKARYGEHSILVGNDTLLHHESIEHDNCSFDGTTAHIAVDGIYAGYIMIGDEIRPDAQMTIKHLRNNGVGHIVMLTGDSACPAKAVSTKLNLDGYFTDLLPEDKVDVFEEIKEQRSGNGKVAFVGDGINDAPVIASADVGVAMGAMGSDAAIETADVVLMTDSPSKLAHAVTIAKETRKIIWQNISMAFLIKGIFIILGSIGLASMWEAVFADMGTALIALANSTRILGKKHNHV